MKLKIFLFRLFHILSLLFFLDEEVRRDKFFVEALERRAFALSHIESRLDEALADYEKLAEQLPERRASFEEKMREVSMGDISLQFSLNSQLLFNFDVFSSYIRKWWNSTVTSKFGFDIVIITDRLWMTVY